MFANPFGNRPRATTEPRRPYALIGLLAAAGVLVIGVLGLYGASGPGLLSVQEAFFITGGVLLVLALTSLYLMFTISDAMRILHIHEQRIPELQKARDAAQDTRIGSLEKQTSAMKADAMHDVPPVVFGAINRIEERLEELERRTASVGTVPGESRPGFRSPRP